MILILSGKTNFSNDYNYGCTYIGPF